MKKAHYILLIAFVHINMLQAQFSVGTGGGFGIICRGSVNAEIALPIELISFESECDFENVVLRWTTESEVDNDFFTVERSLDGKLFSSIQTIDGAGNSLVQTNYEYVDKSAIAGNAYYRLKQTDYNGVFRYSDPIYTNCNQSTLDVLVYPNPITNNVNVELLSEHQTVQYEVLNALQAVIYSGEFENKMNIDLSTQTKGVYFVKILRNERTELIRIVKE